MKKLFILLSFTTMVLFSCDSKKPTSEVETLDEEVANEKVMVKDNLQVEEVLFENEYIKAIRVNLEPKEELPWHKGKERILYPLNDFEVEFKNLNEDEPVEKLLQKDVPNWYQEQIHSVKNIGNTNAKYLIVMRKQKSFPEGKMYGKSELKKAENLNQVVLFDNPSIRVTRVKLESGDKASTHKGIYRLVYALSDYSVSYDKKNQDDEIRNIYKGNAHWHLPGEHSLENVSNQGIADFVIFEFKN
jgi:hypothetical protein